MNILDYVDSMMNDYGMSEEAAWLMAQMDFELEGGDEE